MPEASILINVIIFSVSLILLAVSSDFFVTSAEKVGKSMGLPSYVIGVVIVGIGTSFPELISSVIAVTQNSSEIVIGNVLGSNIANILLIVGISAILNREILIKNNLLHFDIPFLLASTFIIAVLILDKSFSKADSFIALFFIIVYIIYNNKKNDQSEDAEKTTLKYWIMLFASPAVLFYGAKFTIQSVIVISRELSIGSEVIALSAIAFGTSLPELFVTIAAARKKKTEIAIGNIIGSNIFNTFAVMGISGLFGTLIIPANIIAFSLPVSIMVTILFIFIVLDKKINIWEGIIMLAFYFIFIGKVIKLF